MATCTSTMPRLASSRLSYNELCRQASCWRGIRSVYSSAHHLFSPFIEPSLPTDSLPLPARLPQSNPLSPIHNLIANVYASTEAYEDREHTCAKIDKGTFHAIQKDRLRSMRLYRPLDPVEQDIYIRCLKHMEEARIVSTKQSELVQERWSCVDIPSEWTENMSASQGQAGGKMLTKNIEFMADIKDVYIDPKVVEDPESPRWKFDEFYLEVYMPIAKRLNVSIFLVFAVYVAHKLTTEFVVVYSIMLASSPSLVSTPRPHPHPALTTSRPSQSTLIPLGFQCLIQITHLPHSRKHILKQQTTLHIMLYK